MEQIEFIAPAKGTPAAEALAANAAIKVTKLDKVTSKLRRIKRPKMKNFNLVKRMNKRTKRKQKKNLFSKNFKGKVIDGLHELYTLNAGMVLGIRYCMRRSAASESDGSVQNLTLADFSHVQNVVFPPQGSSSRAAVSSLFCGTHLLLYIINPTPIHQHHPP